MTHSTYWTDIIMRNAQNGVRIKSWAGQNVGSGLVKNIRKFTFINSREQSTDKRLTDYSNWQESNVDNPIIVDSCCTLCSALLFATKFILRRHDRCKRLCQIPRQGAD